MPNIRIKDIPTTASATSSTDFIGIDGSANGTRKLNAYSPTFGGNLTVSGTGTSSVAGNLALNGATSYLAISPTTAVTNNVALQLSVDVADNRAIRMTNTASGGHAYDFIPGGGGDAGSLGLYDNTAGSYRLFISGTGNATLAGNLTVSGTGTSTFAGNVAVTGTGTNYTAIDTGSFVKFGNNQTSSNLQLGAQGFGAVLQGAQSGSAAYNILAQPYGGNLLIGTTTDSSNGKLQLATHTTSAGGIGFGTDTPLYRYGAGFLAIDHAGAANSGLFLYENGVIKSEVTSYGGVTYVGSKAGNTIIQSNNNTALTLDSSQNATFAGDVVLGAGKRVAYSASAYMTPENNVDGAEIASPGQFTVKTASTQALKIDSSQNATFAGTSVTVDGASTGSTLTLKRASNANGAIISYKTTTTSKWYHGLRGLVDDNWYLQNDVAGNTALFFDASTSNATFAGGIIGMTQGNVDNISDDGVASFTPLYNRGFIVINNPDYSQNALIAYFKAGSSYLLYSITKSADVTLNNSTTLTGTTGTDGKLNIGYNNSIIYIENRLGGIGNFQRYALGGTNN